MRMWRKGNPCALLVRIQIGTNTMENSRKFPQKKLNVELPYDPAIPLLDVYPKKPKTLIQKDKCTPVFSAALFTTAEIWKQPQCPTEDEWIRKLWYIQGWAKVDLQLFAWKKTSMYDYYISSIHSKECDNSTVHLGIVL